MSLLLSPPRTRRRLPRLAPRALVAAATAVAVTVPLGLLDASNAATKVKTLFSVTTGAAAVDIAPGETATITVKTSRTKGFVNPIYLGVSGVPSGVSVKTGTNPLRTSSSSTSLRITVASTVKPRTFTLTVSGSSKGQTSRATVKVRVGTTTPTVPTTLAPATTLPPATLPPATLPATTTTTKAPTATTTTSPLQDYSLAVEPAIVTISAGSTATATLKITRTGGFAEALTATIENAPTGVLGTVDDIPGNASTSTIRLTASSTTALGSADVTVRARGRTATFKINVVGTSVTASPTAITIGRGATGSVTVTLGRAVSSSVVNWTVDGLPVGASALFSPNATTAVTSTITLSVAAGTVLGTYPLSVKATSDGITLSAVVNLTVSDTGGVGTGTGTVSPATLTLAAGAGGSVTFTPATLPAGTTVLAVAGLPTGATVPQYTQSGTSYALAVQTLATTPAGTYTVTFTATQGGVSSSGSFTLIVTSTTPTVTNQFILSAPTAVTVARNTAGVVTVLVAWTVGVTQQPITFDVTGLPSGTTVGYLANPSPVGTTVTIVVPAGATPGTYPITITGTVANVGTSSIPLALTIT